MVFAVKIAEKIGEKSRVKNRALISLSEKSRNKKKTTHF